MAGCASQTPHAPTPSTSAPAAEMGRSSAALAFDPPIAQSQVTPDLSRDNRGGAALVGFEEPSTSSYDVITYNSQFSDNSSYYDKEALSERTGTTHR